MTAQDAESLDRLHQCAIDVPAGLARGQVSLDAPPPKVAELAVNMLGEEHGSFLTRSAQGADYSIHALLDADGHRSVASFPACRRKRRGC
jgi:hypothetical protein